MTTSILPMDNGALMDTDEWTMDGAPIADTGGSSAGPHGFRWLADEVSFEGA